MLAAVEGYPCALQLGAMELRYELVRVRARIRIRVRVRVRVRVTVRVTVTVTIRVRVRARVTLTLTLTRYELRPKRLRAQLYCAACSGGWLGLGFAATPG